MILSFNAKQCTNVSLAGGKGASLARMTQAGFSVPPGFVVSAQAFDEFLQKKKLTAAIDAELERVNHEDMNSIDRAANVIRDMILGQEFPGDLRKEINDALYLLNKQPNSKVKTFAVRSSATAEDSKIASWAGELETYLNVTKKDLTESVKKCWASLFTPRAIFYRHEKKLHATRVSVAVVVQALIDAELSGVCFTVHPVTKERNQMVIEACLGLGEALVSGQITPDTYVVHKDDLSQLETNVATQDIAIVRGERRTIKKKLPAFQGSKQKLTDNQIKEIANLCKKIEQHYRHPQDIEWAYAHKQWHILQSRPITTL